MGSLHEPQQVAALVIIGSGILSIVVAVRAAQYGQGAVWRSLFYVMLAAAVWCFSDGLFLGLARTDAERWGWLMLGYSASIICVPVTFAFALYFSRLDHWLTPTLRTILWAPFVLAVVLTFTNGWHGLIWDPKLPPLAFKGGGGHGAYFFFMLPVSYGLLLATLGIFLQSFWRLHDIYRRQAVVLSVAVLLPLLASVLYFTPLNPWPGIDLAPVAMAMTGVLLLYNMTRLHMMDLRPIYRDAVFRQMSDGALIVDATGRIVDINPAAQNLLAITADAVGTEVGKLLQTRFALEQELSLRPGTHHLLKTGDRLPRHFALSVTPIEPGRDQPPTLLLVWRDTTALREAIGQIYAQEYALAERVRADDEYNRTIQQAVTVLKSQIEMAQFHLDHGRLGAAGAMLAQMDGVTIEETFKRANEAYAAVVRATGFFDAVDDYVGRFAASNGLAYSLEVETGLDAQALAPAAQLQAVHLLQEALDNVRKHAHATGVTLRFARVPEGIALTIQDDGIGFATADSRAGPAGGGIDRMQQRVQAVDGALTVTTPHGSGTKVHAVFPAASRVAPQAVLDGRRVLLADGHPMVSEGLRALLAEMGMKVTAAEPEFAAIVATLRAVQPDLALVDVELLGADSAAAIQQFKRACPEARIVLLMEAGHAASSVFHNGADGYLAKTERAAHFFEALARIMHDEVPLSPDHAALVMSEYRRQECASGATCSLTARQEEILRMIGRGMTYEEIGARLYLSERTVRYHVDQIRSRLGLSNRTELAAYARRHGMG